MVVGNVPEALDFVVVGGGPGGYTAALAAARAGRRVTLVDEAGADGVGGVCLRVGCIPSKALIEVADLVHRAGEAQAMGLSLVDSRFDLAKFQTWKRGIVEGLTAGVQGLLNRAGVEIVRGSVTLNEPDVAVISHAEEAARFVKFGALVLATGSRPRSLSGLEVDGDAIIDSTGALELTAVPDSLAVIGGGYIGLEIGIALAKLGCAVSVIEAEANLLPAMEQDLSLPLSRRMRELGIAVHLSTRARSHGDGKLELESESGARRIDAQKVLVAVGRDPNTSNLGLETLGVEVGRNGRLEVAPDRRLGDRVAAIGDLTPGPALAHKAMAEAEVAVRALGGAHVAFEPAAIPAVVFSDPEIASVGLTAGAAEIQGLEVEVHRVPVTASGRAATLGQKVGFAQVVSDRQDDAVLGVHIVGPHASELVAEGVLAIEMGATLEDLALTIHPHPTLSEQIADAARLGLA